jgi:hypothetical protein
MLKLMERGQQGGILRVKAREVPVVINIKKRARNFKNILKKKSERLLVLWWVQLHIYIYIYIPNEWLEVRCKRSGYVLHNLICHRILVYLAIFLASRKILTDVFWLLYFSPFLNQ